MAQQNRLQMKLPDAAITGVYADFVAAWHTPDVFVLDFAAVRNPASPVDDGSGNQVMQQDALIVARVRIPPGQVFELMKVLEKQLSAWENETGKGSPDPGR